MELIRSKTYKCEVNNYINHDLYPVLSNKTIMITGATGMIGSCIVDLLVQCNSKFNFNTKIIAVSRNYEKARERFSSYLHDKNFILKAHDVLQPISDIDTCDFIIHAASNAYPASFLNDPVGTMTGNFIGMYNILTMAQKCHSKRVLFVSSGEVYGNIDKELKAEDDYGYVNSMDVRSCYPNSKRAAETLCVCFNKQYGIDSTVVRLSHTFGPTMTDSDNRAASEFIRNCISGQDIIMKSSGSLIRSYTYVFDSADAILTVLAKGKVDEAYNISNMDSVVSIKDFAQIVAKAGNVKLMIQPDVGDVYNGSSKITRQVMNNSKLISLGWQPKADIEKGIEKTIVILREMQTYNK
jgi:UDP-glucuronate decarboxylase